MAEEVGRPTLMTTELMRNIRNLVLEGHGLKEIAEITGISYHTMRDWKYENYEGFSDKLMTYTHERILQKAEANIEQSMSSEDERVRVDVSKFALERLNKKNYSARVENTGADGQPLQIIVPKEVAESFNIHATTQETEGSNTE